jgi:hypothetical protein
MNMLVSVTKSVICRLIAVSRTRGMGLIIGADHIRYGVPHDADYNLAVLTDLFITDYSSAAD